MPVQMKRLPEVSAPTPDPIKSSVLDHARVETIDNFALRNNDALFFSMHGLYPEVLIQGRAYCEADQSYDIGSTTQFEDMWQPATEFTVAASFQTPMVGSSILDAEKGLRDLFNASEGKFVESSLLASAAFTGAASLTPATPIDARTALAYLEGTAVNRYAGMPTIHMPRALGSLLGERIVWDGDKAYTRTGSKVAFGGGYDEQDLSDGLWDMYATGEVVFERSDTVDIATFTRPGDGADDLTPAIRSNTNVHLIQRLYRVAFDGLAPLKITAKVW